MLGRLLLPARKAITPLLQRRVTALDDEQAH